MSGNFTEQLSNHDATPADGVGAGAEAARFRMLDGQVHTIKYHLSPSADASAFVLGVVKGGSTLLHKVLLEFEPYCERKILQVSRKFFFSGIPLNDVVEDVDNLFQQPGYIFGTFRWLPRRLTLPALDRQRKVLLVRDPRDMLVSAYYSFRESHPVPNSGNVRERIERGRKRLQDISLDEYVLGAVDNVKSRYFAFMTLLTTRGVLLRRYEDVIFEKAEFVKDIAAHLDVDLPKPKISEIARKHDVMPDTEDSSEHIRQVKPRNFAIKLSPATVEEITYKLRAVLSEFDYK